MENNCNNDWKVNQTEFAGYVRAKLEDISSNIKEVKLEMNNIHERLNRHTKEISKIKGGAVILGFIAGLVATIMGILATSVRAFLNK